MRMKNDFILRGAKPSKGDYEGRPFDSTKIYVDLSLADGNGSCTAEYNWGDSTNYKKLKDLSLPCDVVVDFELVTTGKSQKTIIHDVQPKKTVVQTKPAVTQ